MNKNRGNKGERRGQLKGTCMYIAMEFFLRLECMYNAESPARVTNEFIKCHPRDGRTTDRIYNYAYEMTRLFHGVVLHVRKEGRKTHTRLSTLKREGNARKILAIKESMPFCQVHRDVESYCRYIIRLPHVIRERIFIAFHIISRYMREAKGMVQEVFLQLLGRNYIRMPLKIFTVLLRLLLHFLSNSFLPKKEGGSIALKWWLNSTVVFLSFKFLYSTILSRLERRVDSNSLIQDDTRERFRGAMVENGVRSNTKYICHRQLECVR